MGVPWISVLISPSAADARHLKVDVDEVVAPNRKKVITASVDPVSEESLIPPQWNVPRAPAEQPAGGVIKPSGRPVPMQKAPSPAGGTGIGAATQQAGRITDRLKQDKTVPKEMNRPPVAGGGAQQPAPPPGPPDTKGSLILTKGVLTTVQTEPAGFKALQSATLQLPTENVTLLVYDLEEEFPDGTKRISGPFLRYVRAPSAIATGADLMLAQHSKLR